MCSLRNLLSNLCFFFISNLYAFAVQSVKNVWHETDSVSTLAKMLTSGQKERSHRGLRKGFKSLTVIQYTRVIYSTKKLLTASCDSQQLSNVL